MAERRQYDHPAVRRRSARPPGTISGIEGTKGEPMVSDLDRWSNSIHNPTPSVHPCAVGEDMQKYTPDRLAEVLRLHKLWLEDDPAGKRANLCGADLRGAYLGDADLGDADLGGAYLGDADLCGANLGDADLGGVDLRDADLGGANLGGAYLRGAYLCGANLCGSNLGGADLRGVDLGGAYLGDADLGDADLGDLKISNLRVFTGLYAYQCWAVVAEEGTAWVRMGCLLKSVEEWDRIGIRNSNPGEFPDDGSEKCEQRVRAFDFTRAEAVRMAEKVKLAKAS